MTLRAKIFVCLVVAGSFASLYSICGHPARIWICFLVYAAITVLGSGMRVAIRQTEGTMPLSFPLVLVGFLQLSPLQTAALAALGAAAQFRPKDLKPSTLGRILFEAAAAITATALAWHDYQSVLKLMHSQVPPALAAASVVYLVADSCQRALVGAWKPQAASFGPWLKELLSYLPFYLASAVLAAAANLIALQYGWTTSLLLIPVVCIVHRVYSTQLAILREREQHVIETEALQLRTIEGLAMAVEAKDQNTHRHLMRVRVYVTEMGKAMGLDKANMKALATASLLHDIGKLAVPEHIINKPGRLTQEEFDKMKIHPIVGADILDRVNFPYPVVPIVRAHHEAWDGSGYPDGLKGEEIPIGARILAAVDCFDALASERPYRRAMPLEEAMANVKSRAGTQFDPNVVRMLEERYTQFDKLAQQEIDEMEPLKTRLLIERGSAPAAGFEPGQESQDPAAHGAARDDSHEASVTRHYDSLNLIAAASQEAKAVFEMSQMLGTSLSARDTSAMMSRRLQPLIPFDCFAVYLKSEESVMAQYIDGTLAHAFSAQHIPLGEGLSGWVAQNERPIMNGNPTVEPNFVPESGAFTETSSALSVPLFDPSGVVFGVLTVYAAKHAAFSKDHLRILQAIQSKFSLSLENAFLYRTAETDARIDHLTQLVNMRYLLNQVDAQVEKACVTGHPFAVAIGDLNSFKAVNDQYGHMVGNDLLRAIARGFRACAGPADTVARMGGDEFAFLFPAMNEETVAELKENLDNAVLRACNGLRIESSISLSIGFAFFPEDGESAEELLGKADREMYLNKRRFYEWSRKSEARPMLVRSSIR